jgi:adenylate cyclase
MAQEAPTLRRLAAVLALDVCGYSRLMGADEEGTLARLRNHRQERIDPVIARHRGRIFKAMGDGVLAEFGSAVDALRCAVEIQRGMVASRVARPADGMELRIGVNVGDVIVEDGDLFGEGVNIAARLEGIATPGGICITERVREDTQGRIDVGFEDAGFKQLKNIDRPIRVHRVLLDGPGPSEAAVAGVDIDLSLPDRPSIAVMPLASLSEDSAVDYFTDGITEDLITELSRFHSLFVIAKASTFTYKGRSVDVRQVARELGVRYVVEGSIRRAGNRVRVTAQLLDGITGTHLWAERYDRTLDDIFAVQEELTRRIISQIAPHIDQAEQARAARRRPGNLTAYEIAVRSWSKWQQAWFRHDATLRNQAIAEAREALRIDPNSVRALNSLAMCQWQHLFYRTTPDLAAAQREALEACTRAMEVDPGDHHAYMLTGMIHGLAPGATRWQEALEYCRRALHLNPNDSLALHALGWIETISGEAESGIEHLRQVMRNNPRDQWISNVHIVHALASFVVRDYEEGIRWAKLASAFPVSHHNIAVCYVGLGDLEQARAALEKARELSPALLEARLNGESVFRRAEDRLRHTTFLRVAAGLDPPAAADPLR